MKPCSKNRKLIALLALPPGGDSSQVIRDQAIRDLRAHFEDCPGCRHYFNEMSKVTEALMVVPIQPEIQATDSLHQRVADAIGASRPRATIRAHHRRDSRFEPMRAGAWWMRLIGILSAPRAPRLALLSACASVIGAMAVLSFVVRTSTAPSTREASPLPMVTGADPIAEDSPTVANYQTAANRSLDEFDQLLARQSRRTPKAGILYTASSILPASSASD